MFPRILQNDCKRVIEREVEVLYTPLSTLTTKKNVMGTNYTTDLSDIWVPVRHPTTVILEERRQREERRYSYHYRDRSKRDRRVSHSYLDQPLLPRF